MTIEEIETMLSQEDKPEFLHPERIVGFTGRVDLWAFNLLDRLCPGKSDMVDSAGHDQIWLSVETSQLALIATAEDIVTLIRCGVFYDEDTASLTMYA